MTWVAVAVATVSAVSAVAAGQQQAQSLKLQSKQAALNAEAEGLEGRRQSLEIQDSLARDLASQNALFGARGILEGEGSAAAAADTARANATSDIENALFNTELNKQSALQRSANLKSDASAAKASGFLKAGEAVAGGFSAFKAAPTKTTVPKPVRKPTLLSGIK